MVTLGNGFYHQLYLTDDVGLLILNYARDQPEAAGKTSPSNNYTNLHSHSELKNEARFLKLPQKDLVFLTMLMFI